MGDTQSIARSLNAAQDILSALDSLRLKVVQAFHDRAITHDLFAEVMSDHLHIKVNVRQFVLEQEKNYQRSGGSFYVSPEQKFQGMLSHRIHKPGSGSTGQRRSGQ